MNLVIQEAVSDQVVNVERGMEQSRSVLSRTLDLREGADYRFVRPAFPSPSRRIS